MKNIFRFTAVVGVLAVWALAVACSDGATPVIPPTPQCSLPQPTAGIMAKKVGEADTAAVAGKITIASGEGVVILWDVQGLSGGEIVSNPPEVIGQPETLIVVEEEKEIVNADGVKEKQKIKTAKGSKGFTPLNNVEFTLKAVNADKDHPCPYDEGGVKPSVSVEVTPVTAKPEVKKFEATPAQINAGESAKLCWEVAPESATVTIADDAGNALVPPVVETTETPETPSSGLSASAVAKVLTAEGDPAPETAATTEVTFKAVDCVDVRPEKTTVYTLNARANDVTATADATVTITPVEFAIVAFAANSVEGSLTLDAEGDVKLTWEVTPSADGVLVSIDNGVGENLPAKGEATVKVSDNTIYTLSASRDGVVLAKQVAVSVNRVVVAQSLNIQLTASGTSVFAGEPVTLSWQVTGSDGGVATLAEGSVVTLVGPDGSVLVSGGGAEVKPMVSGAYSIEVATGGGIYKSNVVNISVRSWDAQNVDANWTAVESFDDLQATFFGKSNKAVDKKEGYIEFGLLTGSNVFVKDVQLDYAGGFYSVYMIKNKTDNAALNDYAPFVFNAFAYNPDKGRVYAATTGALFYSDDTGSKWSIFGVGIMAKGETERPSCKGSTQKGDSVNTFNNLIQYCDIIADNSSGTERVIAASDNGVFYLDDVDNYVKNKGKGEKGWQGMDGIKGSTTANELSGVVVHSLASYGGRIYAGTAKGVWVSDNRGESWAEFNGGDISGSQAIYALAVDGENKKIYASGQDGLFVGTLSDTADWKQSNNLTDSGTVYSVAVDPTQSGAVYIGTDNGVFVSRSFGENWTNVSDTMGGAKNVLEVAVGKNGSKVGIYAATEKGAYSSIEESFSITKVEPAPVIQPVEPAVPASAVNVIKSLAK